MQYFADNIRGDKAMVMLAVEKSSTALQCAPLQGESMTVNP